MLMRCIRAENRKLRRSPIWLLFLAVPAISAIYGTFNYRMNQGILTHGWYDLWTQYTLFYALFFFAPLIGVYAAYLWRLEHRGHNWNLIMTAPVRPFALYAAKFCRGKMALLTQIWLLALFLIGGKLGAGLTGFPASEILLWLLRGFAVGSLPIIAIQLLLSMIIRNFFPAGADGAGRKHSGPDGHHVKRRTFSGPYSLMLMGMNSTTRGSHDRSAPAFPELHCFSRDISPDCRCGSCQAGCQGIIAAAYFSPCVLFFKTKSGRKRILRFLSICFYCTAALFRRLFFHVSTRNSVSTE